MQFVALRHPTLKDGDGNRQETRQPVTTARNLIEHGGWELDERKGRNTDSVLNALKGVKSGYVGGDQGSREQGGEQPPEPSGKAPDTATKKGS